MSRQTEHPGIRNGVREEPSADRVRERWASSSRPDALRIVLTVLPFLLLCSDSVVAADTRTDYDLHQCIELAVENSRQIRIATELRGVAEADADQARARRWPSLVLEANGRYVSDVNEIDLPTVPPRTLRFGDNDGYEVAAGIQLPIYTGGALSANERAGRAAAEASRYDLAADSLRLVHEVRSAYLGALGADAERSAAGLAVERLLRHLGELEGRIALGAASEETRLGVESRLRTAEQRLAAMEERVQVARLGLGAALGLPQVPVSPSGSLEHSILDEFGPGADGTVGSWAPPAESISVEGRPELRALALRHQAGEESRRVAKGAFLPTVSAVAQLHYGDPGVRVLDNEWMGWASAAIELRWTLWDAGIRGAEVESRSASVRALEQRRFAFHEQMENALAIARKRIESRQDQLAIARARTELEARRLELVEGRYREGLGPESELLDAQDDLATAESELASAQAQLRIAESDFLYAIAR